MQTAVLRTLEFDRIVEAVRGYALTPMGDERLAALAPATDPVVVPRLLAATTETAAYIAAHGGFPFRAAGDLPDTLASLAVEGRALEALRLLALASFLDSLSETIAAIQQVSPSFPLLARATGKAASFKVEIAETRRKIEPAGEVLDDASPALRIIRDRLRKQRGRLRTTLESYLRGKDTSRYLQDQVVTERNGRHVLVVRAEHRSSIPGIVHGASASGASVYLEPLGTVEISNDIVALEEQEAEEVHRILLALTDAFRSRPADLAHTFEAAAELDVLQARARFSHAVEGVEPEIASDGSLELLAARHPLLRHAVPVTITIVRPSTALLITGPNTGGKTVALKTVGLLALMAQSGLHIPAAPGSRLPIFRSVFADIGDEQSIDASLSTFSAHITNLAAMDRHLAPLALVLLDEVGSGTDPVEGGALGVAIVDHFRRRGAMLVATSHYDALKIYASTTDGVESAAFGFDPDTFAPTYELVYGTPGRSLALEIAARIGLPASVIAAARANLSSRDTQLAEHLTRLDREVRDLASERQLVAQERAIIDAERIRTQQREEALREREERMQRKLAVELGAETRRARREIDEVLEGLRQKTRAIAREASRRTISTGEAGAVRAEARRAVETIVDRVLEPAGTEPVSPVLNDLPLAVGARVAIGGLGLEGTVTAIQHDSLDVDVRGKRMRASARDVRVIAAAIAAGGRVDVRVELQPRTDTSTDLNVVGCSVDEALARAERFLDESLLNEHHTVRFIHGHGTGQLRRALAGFLREHPLVAQVASAPPEQGGSGVTVVELKD